MELKNCRKCGNKPLVTTKGNVFCPVCVNEDGYDLSHCCAAEWNARQDPAPQPAPEIAIDLPALIRKAKIAQENSGHYESDFLYVQAMAAIMTADCAARTAAAAERQAVAAELQIAHLAKISDTLSILCDLLADAMTETADLAEQDEPTALHMGEALAMGVSICTGGDITRRQLDIRTASRMQMGTDL